MILNVNLTNNSLLSAANTNTPVDPLQLPFFSYTPNLPMQICLLQQLNVYEASQVNFSNVTYLAGGITVQIDDGTPNGIADPFTQQTNWTLDPAQSQFYESNLYNPVGGGLAMNTNAGGLQAGGIIGLLGDNMSASAYLRIVTPYFGQVFAQKILIQAGLNLAGVQPVPAGQVFITLQQALALFVQWADNPPGRGIVLTDSTGLHGIEISAQPNGDGTCQLSSPQTF
jgi:hypothetical protein